MHLPLLEDEMMLHGKKGEPQDYITMTDFYIFQVSNVIMPTNDFNVQNVFDVIHYILLKCLPVSQTIRFCSLSHFSYPIGSVRS